VGLVAACDIAIGARAGGSVAPKGATFAFTEVRIGVVPAVISVPVVPRLLPRAAEELMLTGETFDADRAAAIGLLNRAVDPAALDTEVTRYTDMLARGGPQALAATKAMLRRTPADDMAADFDAMLRLSAEFFASEEGQEGMAAFAEKRSPSWVPEF
jgi:methylglutaconyl-CoA hydratase